MAELNTYQNRIVGTGDEQLDQIMFNPRNWRVHPMNQQNALKGVLEEVGWVQQVIVNQRTGNLIDGHLRCQLAAREGNETIPVTYVDLSDEEEALVLSTLDPIAGMAVTDKEKLDDLFRQFNSDNENVQKLISEIAEKEKLEFGKKDIEDVEPQIDNAELLREKWGVETGQMWKLGEHRIICGDCTDKAVVEMVMQSDRARLVWTDPPYGVNYGAKLEDANPMGYRVRMIENDNLLPAELEIFIRNALINCADYSLPGGAVYVACPAGTLLPTLIASFVGSGYTFHWGLIWLKDQLVLGRGDYHFKHENILYGWKEDGAHYFIDDRKQTSVFEYPRPKSSDEHPTMKPVDLVAHMIGNSSQMGDIVFEPFCGSGTDILACERLSRKCRAIEISPAYVAVSIQRWVDATGGTPELLTD